MFWCTAANARTAQNSTPTNQPTSTEFNRPKPTATATNRHQARGMKAVYGGDGAAPYMRAQMKSWLDLSQRGLPSSLLLLSRALVSRPRGSLSS
jgi:hypothetical protein